MGDNNIIRTMLEYKAWADRLMIDSLLKIPEKVLKCEQKIVFGNLESTINHIHRIDCIWKSHLQNKPHRFKEKTPVGPFF